MQMAFLVHDVLAVFSSRCRGGNPLGIAATAFKASAKYRFFNWELEFPEVFFGPRPGTSQVIDRLDSAGFDCIVGNPPYLSVDAFGAGSCESLFFKAKYNEVWQDKTDILVFFLTQSVWLSSGSWGAIVKSAFLKGAKSEHLRSFLSSIGHVKEVREFRDNYVFDDADVIVATIIGGKKLNGSMDLVSLTAERPFILRVPTIPLGEIAYVGQGMQTGANEAFVVRSGDLPQKWLRRRVRGEDIERFELSEPVQWVLWTEEVATFKDLPKSIQSHLHGYRKMLTARAAYKRGNCEWFRFTWPLHKDYYIYPKLWTPFRSPYNQFCLDLTTDSVGLTDTTCVFLHSVGAYSPYFLLALLNSRLMEYALKNISKSTGGGYHEFFPGIVERLPIRVVDTEGCLPNHAVTKPKNDQILKLVSSDQASDMRASVRAFFSESNESVVHMHSLVVTLAQQLMQLKVQRYAEAKRFLTWLGEHLGVAADKHGNKGVEALTGKSVLKRYFGDHQRDLCPLSWEDFEAILAKNSSRIELAIHDSAKSRGIREEFNRSLTRLAPIQAAILRTDVAINEIVYVCYGLEEEEIAKIESIVKPIASGGSV